MRILRRVAWPHSDFVLLVFWELVWLGAVARGLNAKRNDGPSATVITQYRGHFDVVPADVLIFGGVVGILWPLVVWALLRFLKGDFGRRFVADPPSVRKTSRSTKKKHRRKKRAQYSG